MKKYGLLIPAFLLITLLISSCGLFVSAEAPSPTPDLGQVSTAIDQTLAAQSTSVALLQPSGTPTPTDTETPTETETPTATETPTNTALPSATPFTFIPPAVSCYSAAFLGDVTIPDGSVLNGGESFTKTWAIENTGSCSWNTNFQLVFSSGNLLSASSVVNLPAFVSPGQTVDVSVNMVAPDATGTYEGFWLLRSDTGTVFGVGSRNSAVSVLIVVGSGGEGFAVTHVLMSVDSENITTTCPVGHVFTFTGDITTNGSGTVTYFWQFSNGDTTDENSLDFSSAGTIDVSATWALGTNNIVDPNPFTGWARIYIDNPNHQFFGKQNITLTCSNSPSPTNTPRPTRTATAVPTNTPNPTNTPRPTRTPTPGPTNTPRPTNTARPSRTPRPSSTPRPTRTPTL